VLDRGRLGRGGARVRALADFLLELADLGLPLLGREVEIVDLRMADSSFLTRSGSVKRGGG